MQDFLLDSDNDLLIKNGDIAVGESTIQEVALILGLKQGELKSDPILGPNLFYLMKSKGNKNKIETAVKLHLNRDNKDYESIKKIINVDVEN